MPSKSLQAFIAEVRAKQSAYVQALKDAHKEHPTGRTLADKEKRLTNRRKHLKLAKALRHGN